MKHMAITGKILKVDLTTRSLDIVHLDKNLYKQYIGGAGLATRILYPLLEASMEPLSPGAPLVFMAGALAGTNAPNCGRHVICARSPLTGIWGESNSGGFWGAELKRAGLDGIFLTGKSETPCYLSILDEDVEIRDAGELWGKTTSKTEQVLKAQAGDDKTRVASIGPAGEHLVSYAAVINDEGRAAGRTGMGAVMGSKNLKAVAVRGTKKLQIADRGKFDTARKQLLEEIGRNFTNNMFKELGTAGYLDMAAITGDLSFKYFTQGTWDGSYDISGSSMSETILKKNKYCRQCTIGCGRIVEVEGGKYETPGQVDGPEYETLGSFGASILCNNLEGIAKANYLCNELGLDTISCGIAIAFAYYLQDKGMLSKKDAGGLELKWGDIDPALVLIKQIAYREGLGRILANGIVAAGKELGVPKDEIAAVNGMAVPFHEPRAYLGSALEYATSHRGACHQTAQYYLTSMGAPFDDVGIHCIDRFEEEGVAACVARLQDLRAVFQSLSMCNFIVPSTIDLVADLFEGATGIQMDAKSIMKCGTRIMTLHRLVNLNLGYETAEEKLPGILLEPLDGGTEGHVPNLERQLEDYYTFRDWDRRTGIPSREKIKDLDLEALGSVV
ncbi:aldehyde ferredoxin oxidoreductase [Candidatus Bathyarchaeota archaeon]|nr:aldehyde ferredoxin oxidoreductase [Candidatus Bathyarchaeota archaeon]